MLDKMLIEGGSKLEGEIIISGSKNAALPIMAASLLTDETVVLSNVPQLADVVTMSHLLINHGVNLSVDGVNLDRAVSGRTILLNAENVSNYEAPYDIVRKMRASILVLGPLLTRYRKAIVSLPGGCAIGTRPINMHLEALKSLGAKIDISEGYIIAEAKNGLKGNKINFDSVSVGATENVIMAASLAEGETLINNAACEPEVVDLCNLLVSMGAKIKNIGTSRIVVEGVKKLKGAYHEVISDRIEAGTFAIAALITKGEILLRNINHLYIANIIDKLSQVGAKILVHEDSVRVKFDKFNQSVDLSTNIYPGFPTDLQAQFMTLMTVTKGNCRIVENIFENRFMHVPELMRMGADIKVSGNTAHINGVESLKGAEVMATDLRASVSLVLAGLVSEGSTMINRIYHIDRGYEKIEDKLNQCGAKISRVTN
ncbi:MAG: UDP-N-acetylglucosamine 1-carboxyvinyltransferase [Rickettsiales bacterium]